MGATLAYAFTLGLVGLLNPCGFPLLPAYLAMFVDAASRAWYDRLWAALRAGLCLTAGFVGTFGILGLVAGSLAGVVMQVAPWAMLAIGAGLCFLGVLAVLDRMPRLRLPGVVFPTGRGALAMAGFGVAYAVGSLSCSLPIFLAGVGASFSAGSVVFGFAAFVAYALGMGLFVTAASVLAAFAGGAVLRSMRRASVVVPRIAGGLCIVVGLYSIGYGMNALGMPDPLAWSIAYVDRAQSAVTAGLGATWPVAAVVSAVVVCASLLVLALRRSESEAGDRPESEKGSA